MFSAKVAVVFSGLMSFSSWDNGLMAFSSWTMLGVTEKAFFLSSKNGSDSSSCSSAVVFGSDAGSALATEAEA